jgi:hypothetical protein
VERVSLAFSPRVELDLAGLPRCKRDLLEMSAREAIETCGEAKLGSGMLETSFRTPELEFAVDQRINAYNGTSGGRPAVLAQTFASDGLVTVPPRVIPFVVEHGRHGDMLKAEVQPETLRGHPTITNLEMTLGRRYRAGSEVRSVVSVNCQGAHRSLVPLVDIGFGFSDGTDASVLTHGRCIGR